MSTPFTEPTIPIDREAARRDQWPAEQQRKISRVLILGGGFGGLYTAHHLEKIFRRNANVQITLVSRDNYFLMTPLLFEAGSGVLEPRHAVNPIRPMLKKTRFVVAEVQRVDFEKRVVYARHTPGLREMASESTGELPDELPYDHLVLALGGVTNRGLIPGSEHAIGFKTLGDAIFLRNGIIDLFEQADIEEDPAVRQRLLTFVVIGGGLVGIELLGELTEFTHNLLRNYPRIGRDVVKFVLIEANGRILPEMEEDLAAYAAHVLAKRGVNVRTGIRVKGIERGRVLLPAGEGKTEPEVIDAETILLAAGVVASPLLTDFPLAKAHNGRVEVAATMRCKQRPEVWALGDCAAIPDKKGKPYPPLAQHALREAKVLARNIAAVIGRTGKSGGETELEPFVYETLGMLASLGHFDGVGRIMKVKLRGFLAWWVWRTYYLMQMPRMERKLRVMMDWTIALVFRNDVVKLDLFGEEHPTRRRDGSHPPVMTEKNAPIGSRK